MTLQTNFELYAGSNNAVRIIHSYKDRDWPGNPEGTCGGQALVWLKVIAGRLAKREGLQESLLSNYEKAAVVHFVKLKGGLNAELSAISDKTINLLGHNTGEQLKAITPWSGKFKIYEIASATGHGHFMGAYFPWSGSPHLYDPNLAHCEISDGKFYDVLAKWRDIYQNVDNTGIWGFEYLYVIADKHV